MVGLVLGGPLGASFGATVGLLTGKAAADEGEDRKAEYSEALRLARCMCKE